MRIIKLIVLISLFHSVLEAQINVKARIDHIKPDGADTLGNIYLTVSGGTSPYSYQWSPGGSTNKDLTNATANSYTVKVKGSANDSVYYKYKLGYKTYWTNFITSYFRNDTLLYYSTPSYSTTSAYWCTALSKNTLRTNTDGWIQWVVNNTSHYVMAGFTDSASVAKTGIWTDIDYGFYQTTTNLYRVSDGTYYYLSTCAAGDVLRIERVGNTVYYKKNDVTLTSYTIAISRDWKIKSSTYSSYNANIGASFMDTTKTNFPNYVEDIPLITHCTPGSSNGTIKLTPRITGATHNYTWSPGSATTNSVTSLSAGSYTVNIMDADSNTSNYKYSVGNKTYWTNFFGTRFRNDSLLFQSPTSPTGWNTALSKNTLKAGTDGWVEFIAKAQTETYIVAFVDSATSISGVISDNDYGVYLQTNKLYRSSTLLGSYKTGDVIRIQRTGSTFYIKVNGNIIHSESCATNKDWKIKAYLNNAAISNIGASFVDTTEITFANYVQDFPLIKHCTPGLNDGSISLSPKISGTSHTYTWSPGGANTNSVTGLSVGNYSVSIKDADYNTSNYSYNVGYKTYWTNFYGSKSQNDSITIQSPASPSGYNTLVSKNTLKSGTNGWLEYVITSTTNNNRLGFFDSAAVISGWWEDLDYAFSFSQNYLYRYTSAGYVFLGGYCIGDVLRLERTGSVIYFKVNGITQSTVACSTNRDWKIKVAINNGSVNNIGCSFFDSTNVNFPNYVQNRPAIINSSGSLVSNGSVSLTPMYSGSTQTYTWSPDAETSSGISNKVKNSYTVTAEDADHNKSTYTYDIGYKPYWKDFYSSFSRNDSIFSSNPPSGSWATAVAKNSLPANINGYAQYVVTSTSGNTQALGFLDSAYNSTTYTDIDYGVYQNSGYLYFCSNTTLTAFWYCRVGDVIRIERIGNVFYCKINNLTKYSTTISAPLLAKNWKLKAAKSNSNPTYFANIGCSFPTDFNFTVEKYHADADNQKSGSISVFPYAGTAPYTYLWNDGDNTPARYNLSAGTYTVVISDSLQTEKVGKIITIGIKPNWKTRKNIRVTSDSTYLINPDSLGTLISENYIKKNDKGWHEVTINSITQDIAMGLIGLPETYMDTTITPPLYPDSAMNRKSDLAYALMRLATKDSLVYGGGSNLLQLSADYDYVHLARITNGQIKPLFRNAPSSAVFSYAVGDVIKIGRDVNGRIYLARNDTTLYTQNSTSSTQYLYSSMVAKTNPKAGKGGVSNPIPLIPFPTCANDNTKNWTATREFDEFGNVVSESRQYFDNLGRATQAQVKIISDNNIIANENMYDSHGRAIGSTLPAPLYSTYNCYSPTFFANTSGNHYNVDDFDKPKTLSNAVGEVNNPSLAGKTLQGTLGWYYSDNNTSEALMPSDSFPYSRVEYSNDPLSRMVKIGGVGRHHKMGSGRENLIIQGNSLGELLSVFPKKTYELDENFNTKIYPIGIVQNVAHALKTIEINADGHDKITYTSDNGKVLATCVSGYDTYCPSQTVNNDISRTSYLLLHIPQQQNNTLKITEVYGSSGITINNIDLLIRNYNTKQLLVKNTDYSISITNNVCAVTFLGDYATKDLFLEIAYTFVTGYTPIPNYNYHFFETHNLGYTQWTVYYYDIKGRLKAIQSPHDVVCGQSPVSFKNRQDTSSLAFPCDSGTIGNISLDSLSNDPADPIYAQQVTVELTPQFKLFNQFLSYNGNNHWRFQAIDSVVPRDTMFNYPPCVSTSDTNIVYYDTAFAPPYYINDTALWESNISYHDNTLNRIRGKQITYEGKYHYSIAGATGSSTVHPSYAKDFSFTLRFDDAGNGSFANNTQGDVLNFIIPDSLLPNASNIILKCSNLRIKLTGFGDSPVSLFSPCDKDLYVCPSDTELLSNINANVNMVAKAIINTTPPPSVPITATYSRKYTYNEYNHLIAYENEDEGRTDFVYDLKEDKLLFSQNDKQRADAADFSYIKYDKFGRVITSGLYRPSIADPINPTNNVQFQTYTDWKNGVPVNSGYLSTGFYAQNDFHFIFSASRQKDQTFIEYDFPVAGMPLTSFGYSQKCLGGKISRVYNDNSSAYYSYDEEGRLTTVIQDIAGLGGKSLEYGYDLRGKLTQSIYQKNVPAETFVHIHTYDADERLKKSYITRSLTVPLNLYPVSAQSFYQHGALKRSLLGNNLQGLDYVYTVNGLLKAVNNPFTGGDPGNDGGNGVSADIFSYALDYYPKDYERTYSYYNSNKTNGVYNNFNVSYTGLINSIRWRNVYPSGAPAPSPANISGPFIYEYNYDELYRLKGVTFGNYSVFNPGLGYLTDVAISAVNSFKLQNINYDRNGNLQTLERNSDAGGAGVPMDVFTYNYDANKRNRLNRVNDAVTTSLGFGADIDMPNQSNNNNYTYNAIGRVVNNIQDDQVYSYNNQGLVTSIKKYSSNNMIAEFAYNDRGLRQAKTSYNSSGTAIAKIYYVYDENGSLIATYNQDLTIGGNPITISDFVMYSDGRAGIYDMASNKPYFELTDHVGNVRSVFTDNSGAASPVSYTDHYPHGGVMPGRQYVNSPAYRYNYQGQEKDGETNLVNFELRQMDPRLGRWFNPDPYGQHHSPYLAMSNNPFNNIDPDGGYDDWFQLSKSSANLFAADNEYFERNGYDRYAEQFTQRQNGMTYEDFYRERMYTSMALGGYEAQDGSVYHLDGGGNITREWFEPNPNGVPRFGDGGGGKTKSENIGKIDPPEKKMTLKELASPQSKLLEFKQNSSIFTSKPAQGGGGNGNGTSAGAITIALPNISDIPLIGNSPVVKALSIFSMIDKSLTNAMTERFTPKGKVRPLTKSEIKRMQDNGVDPHDLKPSQGNGQKIDLYRDVLGDIYYRMEGSKFYNPTFYNWYKIVTP